VSGPVSFHRELAALRWQHHHYLAAKNSTTKNTTKMRAARPTKLNHFSAFPLSSFNWAPPAEISSAFIPPTYLVGKLLC